jgi:uncharacterized cupin superfamily protein
MRHWHTHEDEFVYVLEGEVVLRTDAAMAPTAFTTRTPTSIWRGICRKAAAR